MFGIAITLGHDKLNHAAAFAVLATVGYVAWPDHRAKLAALLVLTAAAIEVLQSLQAIGRYLDAWDWAAGSVGMACGLQIANWTRNFAGALRYNKRRFL
ncbi:MAG: hypothetical protein EOR30_18205 [Mesorhizobium sp.]|uniref:hypothetical protein n=1 Tax=unclassified Mesorhizobium TaxID=325217 RepID=UPI000FC9F8D9|nr:MULTISPECIES: hypothetical protein [unclassified Mesorhizobium]RUV72948.1 hypothetical protein EOA78_13240 [Mesorhizobium sp. M5C.F.Cr.IN.023.01.1.1]RWF83830.1 MAG: hypothetical protein EOQ36_26730 [Mesorhizobium sp.]RWF90656.1 MAG: hypothetical protein EOQ45_29085 [Mesorhizobium sp.]RWH45292.1 MAG: hypothetical protein EOQ80_19475 [Mesorhizobium sp.]RWI40646.1 MAG: hypothetical protein EOR14_12845 [Mesorhizobium sp.]